MQESTITVKGQTTLPKHVRQALSLQPGDKVRYLILDGGEVRIVRARNLSSLAGTLKHPVQRPVSLEEMEDAIATGAKAQ